jgi:type II secretion system protein C
MPNSRNIPKRLKEWLSKAKPKRSTTSGEGPSRMKDLGTSLKERIPGKIRNLDFNFKEVELKNISEYSSWIERGLIVLALFLLAGITSGIIGLFIRPSFPPIPKKQSGAAAVSAPTEDYDAILRRNVFNVEGKIPDAWDQGMLDCMSQARPSQQHVTLLGTIVMNDERQSTALIQDESAAGKLAVKQNDVFGDGKYVAKTVLRKKLCFQVKATEEFEYIEIPEENLGMEKSGGPAMQSMTEGITPLSENDYVVKQNYLEKNLLNLNEILQTARAVPYVEPGTGKFKGFLVQTVDPNSPFAALGIKQGDVLTGVNDIVLDNAGKGLEAFQRLRTAPKITLQVIRGGQSQTLNYNVQ